MDGFTARRLQKFVETFRPVNGRDPAMTDFVAAGFPEDQVKDACRSSLLVKYQTTGGTGSIENRFKIQKDWKTLNTPVC